jgi:hypothetical protein
MMITSGRITCFWPGLSAAWLRGNPRALAHALLACWSLCLLLLATFVWPQWIPVWTVRGLWFLAISLWMVECVRSHWNYHRLIQVGKPLEPDDAFMQAQADYLAGNWFEAEAKLLHLLSDFPRDAECQLLLVGILRHTGRHKAGLRRLDHLETWDSAARWHFEIANERAIIQRAIEDEGNQTLELSNDTSDASDEK